MKALVSVYDRTGAVEFAGKLVEAGFEIISTGGTRAELTACGAAGYAALGCHRVP